MLTRPLQIGAAVGAADGAVLLPHFLLGQFLGQFLTFFSETNQHQFFPKSAPIDVTSHVAFSDLLTPFFPQTPPNRRHFVTYNFMIIAPSDSPNSFPNFPHVH